MNTANVLTDYYGTSREESSSEIRRSHSRGITESFRLMGTVLDIDWGPLTSTVDTYCNGALSMSAGFLAGTN